jgi:hypothetical protein
MTMLQLSDDLLLAQGAARFVYRHPEAPQHLIKIFRPDYIERKFGAQAPWYKRSRRIGYLVAYQREWQEQYAAFLNTGAHPRFMQFIAGHALTSRGLGQVVEAVRGRDGDYAPTLYKLLDSGRFDATATQALQDFFDWLLSSPIVISELNTVNLLYRYDPQYGEHFCLIDGVGDPNLIPIKSWSTALNQRGKRRWIAKMWQRLAQIQAKKSA